MLSDNRDALNQARISCISRKASQLKLHVNLFFKRAFGVNWKLAKMAKTTTIQVVFYYCLHDL